VSIARKCEPIAFTSKARKPILRGVNPSNSPANSPLPLADLRRGDAAVVAELSVVSGAGDDRSGSGALVARLRDLGFIPGARCEVMARMWLGGDPLVVRIGGSTFALRRAEAAAVRVTRVAAEPAERIGLSAKQTSVATA
jgi:ferrous iron transport protein A